MHQSFFGVHICCYKITKYFSSRWYIVCHERKSTRQKVKNVKKFSSVCQNWISAGNLLFKSPWINESIHVCDQHWPSWLANCSSSSMLASTCPCRKVCHSPSGITSELLSWESGWWRVGFARRILVHSMRENVSWWCPNRATDTTR